MNLLTHRIYIIPEHRFSTIRLRYDDRMIGELAKLVYKHHPSEEFQERLKQMIQFTKTYSDIRIRPVQEGIILEVRDQIVGDILGLGKSLGSKFVLTSMNLVIDAGVLLSDPITVAEMLNRIRRHCHVILLDQGNIDIDLNVIKNSYNGEYSILLKIPCLNVR